MLRKAALWPGSLAASSPDCLHCPCSRRPTIPQLRFAVLQQGSLGQGELFASVLMMYRSHQMQAELLVDTGCNMGLNIIDFEMCLWSRRRQALST